MANTWYLLISLISGILFTYIARATARRTGIMNAPNAIVPQHKAPVAYLGGFGIVGGLLAGGAFAVLSSSVSMPRADHPLFSNGALVGIAGYLLLGLIDDLHVLKPLVKLAGQTAIAIVCAVMGIKLSFTQIGIVDYPVTVFWILFCVNAANFIDVCDGLLGSVCLSTFLVIALFVPGCQFCFIFAGSIAGFLIFNFPPASIFLGDAGSLVLGFLLAATGIFGFNRLAHADGLTWMIFICMVPVFELVFITSIRIYKGIPWWKGSPDHFSLRLQKSGYSKKKVILIACLFTIAFSGAACWFPALTLLLKCLLMAVSGIILVKSWMYLLK